MPNLPNRGEAGSCTLPQVTIGENRSSHSRTAAANASKNFETQNTEEAATAAEVRPKKGNAEAETPLLSISPLLFIADSLTLLLGTEKVGSAVQKRIEKTIAFARDADTKEKDKGKATSPQPLPEDDLLKLSIRADLVLMYEALAKLLGNIQSTTNNTLSNVHTISMITPAVSGESKSLAAKLGKVSDCMDKIASSNTAYRNAVTVTNVHTSTAKLDPKVLRDMER